MPIKAGENPEGHPLWNKYLATGDDQVSYGTRGFLVAISPDRTEALIEDGQGQLLLVREPTPGQWPVVVHPFASLTDAPDGWKAEGPIAISPDEDALIVMLRRPSGTIVAHASGLRSGAFVELPAPVDVPPGYRLIGLGARLKQAGPQTAQRLC